MSDTPESTAPENGPDADAPEPQTDAQAAPQGKDDADDEDELPAKVRAKLEKANREAQNLRSKLKDLEPLAKRAKELEDAQKTETERLNDQLAAREVELQELRVERVRNQAGQNAKLDPDLWEFITAVDPDEALAQAKRLAARTAIPEPGPANLRQGSRTPAKSPTSANDVLRGMAGFQ